MSLILNVILAAWLAYIYRDTVTPPVKAFAAWVRGFWKSDTAPVVQPDKLPGDFPVDKPNVPKT